MDPSLCKWYLPMECLDLYIYDAQNFISGKPRSELEIKVDQLSEMGFSPLKCEEALGLASGNVEKALEILFNT